MGKTRAMLVYKRRLQVKKRFLQGQTVAAIAEAESVSEAVIRTDLKAINKQYIAAVTSNGNILEKQAEYILKHLDQLSMVKEKLWELESTAQTDKNKISALKALLDELNHEAKVLRLIDVSKTINQYIKIDKIEIVLNKVIDVIKEFVPLDQQKYALIRLKKVGESIIDIESK